MKNLKFLIGLILCFLTNLVFCFDTYAKIQPSILRYASAKIIYLKVEKVKSKNDIRNISSIVQYGNSLQEAWIAKIDCINEKVTTYEYVLIDNGTVIESKNRKLNFQKVGFICGLTNNKIN